NLSGETKCWITKNLGATNQASSATDATEAAAGWYWQFNLKQGYKHDGITRTPNTAWITSNPVESNWLLQNDPCTLELGLGWRLPTSNEWANADTNGGWDNYTETYASVLKLHAAGALGWETGNILSRGTTGYYLTSTNISGSIYVLSIDNFYSNLGTSGTTTGISIRCLKD
ncbi:MAG TPA: hypothetical protein PKX78_04240, partial [Candidatus Woesebacteria bacterium]|nr:hypothetical protein [Candidatus Woesebacteria bacterium]